MRQKLIDQRHHLLAHPGVNQRHQRPDKHVNVLIDGLIDRIAQHRIAAKQVGQPHAAPLELEAHRELYDERRLVGGSLRI